MVSCNWHPLGVLTVTIISNQSCFQQYQELTGPSRHSSFYMGKEYQGERYKDKRQVVFVIRTLKNSQALLIRGSYLGTIENHHSNILAIC